MMGRIFTLAAAFAASLGAAAMAQDFSANSEARPWNLETESKARFEGKVVDVLCELAGDCTEDCGAGRRQLGLVRSADNALVLVNKNAQPVFSGGVEDLLPYCNQNVEVDGLLVGPEPTRLYLVQRIRTLPDGKWSRANRFTRVWNEKNPDGKAVKGPWFRKDPRITSRIEAEGYLGLGKEADEAFIKEWF